MKPSLPTEPENFQPDDKVASFDWKTVAEQRASVDLKLHKTLLWLARITLFAAVLFMLSRLYPLLNAVLSAMSPFIVALIVAYIFNPVVRILQHRLKLGRTPALGITYALILGIAGLIVTFLIPIVYEQSAAAISSICEHLPTIVKRMSDWFKLNITQEDLDRVKTMFSSDNASDTVQKVKPVGNRMMGVLADLAQWGSHAIVSIVTSLISGATFMAFTLMISAYFLLDYTGIWRRIGLVVIPRQHHERSIILVRKIDRALGGYLRGQLTVCLLLGVLYSCALMALGLKSYAIIIGMLAGFGNMIPYFGPLVGAVPTLLWIVFSDYYGSVETKCMAAGAVGILTVVLQSLDGWVFQPRIVGANAELPPLFVLCALIIGSQFGLTGMVLAVPLGVIARVLMIELWWKPLIQRSKEAGMLIPDGEEERLNTVVDTKIHK